MGSRGLVLFVVSDTDTGAGVRTALEKFHRQAIAGRAASSGCGSTKFCTSIQVESVVIASLSLSRGGQTFPQPDSVRVRPTASGKPSSRLRVVTSGTSTGSRTGARGTWAYFSSSRPAASTLASGTMTGSGHGQLASHSVLL
eukprot:3437502-Rhodomonas_salina.1